MAVGAHRLPLIPPPSIGPEGARLRLRTLVGMRWIALIGQAAALSFVYLGLGYELPYVPAMAVVMLSGGLNVAISMLRPSSSWLGEQEALLTLGFDLLQLSVLLWLTGGLQNPFALLILAPVAVAAWTLSRWRTLALALWATSLVTLLSVWHLPLPWPEAGFLLSPLYTAGIWTALVIGIFFVAVYVYSIAAEAERMSRALSAAQMALAREQRLSELGGVAAAAAHELGSPLGTIAVVAGELARDLPKDSPQHEDIQLLLAESRRCRDILSELAETPPGHAGAPYHDLPFTALVETVAERFERDGVTLEIVATPFEERGDPPPEVDRDPEVIHGLGSLIQNAVQFAHSQVGIVLDWDETEIAVTIRDDGPGFDLSMLSRLGEPYFSTGGRDVRRAEPRNYMGLGIFIAGTLLSHSGARLAFANARGGGAKVEIRWPRERLDIGRWKERKSA